MTLTKTHRLCVRCYGSFMAGTRTARYCSKKCRDAIDKPCEICGGIFVSRKGDKTKTCSLACKTSGRKYPQKGSLKPCESCGNQFSVVNVRFSRTCSRKCAAHLRLKEGTNGHIYTNEDRHRMYLNRIKASVKMINTKYMDAISECPLCRKIKGWKTIVATKKKGACHTYCSDCRPLMRMIGHGVSGLRTRVCCVCFKERTNNHLQYDAGKRCVECEAKCKARRASEHKHLRRARMKTNGPYDKGISLGAVNERDGGLCHICGSHVNLNDRVTGNMYPSIDHVIPLSKGGSHTWDNVKLAHRWCNSKKSDTIEG